MALHLLDIQSKRGVKKPEAETKRIGKFSAKRLVSYLT